MHENEIFVLFVGSAIWFFVGLYRHTLSRLPAFEWLFASYAGLWVAWVATNLEHLMLPRFFNVVEHVGYAINGTLLFAWCWFGMRNGKAAHHG